MVSLYKIESIWINESVGERSLWNSYKLMFIAGFFFYIFLGKSHILMCCVSFSLKSPPVAHVKSNFRH